MPTFPVHVPLGPWALHPHLVFEALAYAAGFQTFLWLRRHRVDVLDATTRAWLLAAAVVGAAIGAKVLYWAIDPAHTDWRAPAVFWGGKTIMGAILGGHLAVEWAKRRMGVHTRTGDLYVVPLAVAIAVGRIGCFLSGLPDATHGVATGAPWGVDFGDGVARHPTQLYEMVVVLGLAAWSTARARVPGAAWRSWFVGYAAWRLTVGFIQPMPRLLGLGAIQWAALAVVAWHLYMQTVDPTVQRRPAPAGEADHA